MAAQTLLDKLRGLLKLASEHTEASLQAKVEAFLILCRLHRQTIVWQDTYDTWRDLLVGEKIGRGPWGHFFGGFQALEEDEARVRKLGYTAVIYLGRSMKKDRKLLASRLKTESPKEVFVNRKRTVRVTGDTHTRAELAQYIQILKASLKKKRIPIPKPPWVS